MFKDKKLSQLKKIQVDPEKKEEDFNKIQQRLNSKPFHWQILAVIIAIACITLFLVGTFPPKHETTSEDMDSNELQAVYYMQWEGDPKSTLQAGVKRMKNEEILKEIATVLQQFKQINKNLEDSYVSQSYRLQFKDRGVMRLQEYRYGEGIYYRDVDSGQIYELNENPLYAIISSVGPADRKELVIISIFVLLIFATNKVSKKLRDPEDPKRHLPIHSTYWQSGVEILTILIMVLLISVPQLHLFQLFAFFLLSALFNILLEVKHGKNKWRMVQFILWKLYMAVFMYSILWSGI